ncbi:MAG: PAS domain S-box protein [Nonlabens sp.]
MVDAELHALKRALARERKARKQAESILEAKSAELYSTSQELQKSNLKLKKLVKRKTSELEGVFENIVDAYVVTDLLGNVLKMNMAAVELLEAESENDSINILNLAKPSELENITHNFQKLLKEGAVTDVHIWIVTKTGAEKLVHINCSIIYDNAGRPKAGQGIVRDITAINKADKQLKKSESRLSTLILNLENGVLLESEDRKIVLTNKKFCQFFQIPLEPEQMIGFDCSSAAEQSKGLVKQPEKFVKRIDQVLRERKTVIGDELNMVDGRILERDFIPIIENGKYSGHLWSYRDVTLNRSYRKSLEAQKEKYSSIIANMNLGLVEVDNTDRILMTNQRFQEMSGYREEELLHKSAADLFLLKESEETINEETQKRLEGVSDSYELTVKNKAGNKRVWLISGAPNYNIKGEVIGSIGIHLDITDLKDLERQKERLLEELKLSNEELNEYAHVVSHDLKSPLRSIYALVNWLKEDNEGKLDQVSLQNISLIEETLEKMELLIGDILNYSSINAQRDHREPVDLNILMESVLGMVHVPEFIEVKVAPQLPVLNADPTKMNQLFQNLISNAVKFMDKKEGRIEVSFEDLPSHYSFAVSDNGKGIAKDYHNTIFKIFQTIEKRKESTGIGLSIVKKIVESYGGRIWVDSEEGKGATFRFTIKKEL